MSPFYFTGSYAYGHDVNVYGGCAGNHHVDGAIGARPVFNLTSDILKNGDGTSSNPYHA